MLPSEIIPRHGQGSRGHIATPSVAAERRFSGPKNPPIRPIFSVEIVPRPVLGSPSRKLPSGRGNNACQLQRIMSHGPEFMNVNSRTIAPTLYRISRLPMSVSPGRPRETSKFCTEDVGPQSDVQNSIPLAPSTYDAADPHGRIQNRLNIERGIVMHFIGSFGRAILPAYPRRPRPCYPSPQPLAVEAADRHKLRPIRQRLLYPSVQADIVHRRSVLAWHSRLATGGAGSQAAACHSAARPGPAPLGDPSPFGRGWG